MIIIENNKVANEYLLKGGKKWRLTDPDNPYIEVKDEWGFIDKKLDCVMKKSYIKSCYDTQLKQERHDIRVAKEKLLYQLKTYGEVDPIDVGYYKSLCRRFGYSCPKFDEMIA